MSTVQARQARGIARYASLVKLSHTVFAAPFAIAAALLASRRPHVPVTVGRVIAIGVCLVCARTAAMAYNRLVDRDVDAKNPRTAAREIPSGVVSVRGAAMLVALCSIAFVGAASTLGSLPGLLAFPVLAVLLGYSHAKRFTWAAHLWLGLALALAPGGAWIAMGARPSWGVVALMLAVLSWVAGFDVLYSLQDENFDRSEGLRSIPARFGARGARAISRSLHLTTVVGLAACGLLLGRGVFYALATALVAGLLLYEHGLVSTRPDGSVSLSRINQAFFDVNGWVSLGFLALVAVDTVLGPVGEVVH
jgi:4-hydroxybenzoate polyprenyltransferase